MEMAGRGLLFGSSGHLLGNLQSERLFICKLRLRWSDCR
jgi:hypothetical protein